MIKAEDIYFSYNGTQSYVLRGLDLEIADGDYVSILGENGSGKSTLAKLILRLLRPSSGTITNTAKRIGYLSQKKDSTTTDFPITVYEMLNSYRRLIGLRDREAINRALEQVGMPQSRDALIGSLSGGQCQRVFIARALLGDPELLVLDEPSAGIDQASQLEIYRIVKRLNSERGMTIVSVEHNLGAAISNSTLIYHLTGGRGHRCTPEHYAEDFLKTGKGGDGIA